MNIRLFRIYSVPIRISSLELHVPGTCLFILWVARGDHVPFHVWNSVGWHVATTCHPRRLFVFLCISGGTYIYVPIHVHTIEIHDLLNKVISLIVSEVSLAQFYFLFDGPGMSFVEGIVFRRLRRRAATATQMFEYDKFHSTGAGKTVRKQSVFLVYQTKFRFPFQHGKPNSLSF